MRGVVVVAVVMASFMSCKPAEVPLTPDEVREKLRTRERYTPTREEHGVRLVFDCPYDGVYSKAPRDAFVSTDKWRAAEAAGDLGSLLSRVASISSLICTKDDYWDPDYLEIINEIKATLAKPEAKR